MNPAKLPAQTRDVDVRGFVYALEPVHQRQQWRLDKSMAALARAQQDLLEIEAKMTQVQEEHDVYAKESGQRLHSGLDPAAHRRTLDYLAHLRGRWEQLALQRDALCIARDGLRQECLIQQMKLDGLSRHKEDALTEYADEVRRRSSNEQDRDWLARRTTPNVAWEAE